MAHNTVIQAISIPTHSTRQTPDPHVVFDISVSTATSHYILPQRYSAFVELHTALAQEVGQCPPGDLPSRRRGGWFGLGGGRMSETQLEERRVGLERWIRGLLASRDPRWAGARCFREFLAAPPIDQRAGDGGNTARGFTAATWLLEHSALVEEARSLRSTLNERDASRLNSSSVAHSLNATAKKGLVDLVTRLGALTASLHSLGQQGMTDGELRRREEMLGRLQEEAEGLGKLASGGPRVGEGRMQSGQDGQRDDRNALMSGGAGSTRTASRVLGVKAQNTVKETAETRPLDDRGLLSLQQTYMDQQDSKLEGLTAAIRRQRALGEMIGEELRIHDELLDRLETSTDKTQSKLKEADKMARRL